MSLDIFNSLFSNIWSIFLVIAFFGGSIFVHELGHFLAARKRGLKIERFSIGFGPKIFGWKKNGVDYRVSLLPLGGYVALPQLGDMEQIEGKSQKKKHQLPPISYADKMIVSVMGAVFNLIFAFILATLLWIIGQPSSMEQQTATVGYVSKTIHLDAETEVPGPGFVGGFLPGDKVLKVDGEEVANFRDIQQVLLTGAGRDIKGNPEAEFMIERGQKRLKLIVKPELVQVNTVSDDRMRHIGISPQQSLLIGSVFEHSPAELAGIKPGDELISANGERLYSLSTLSDLINENKDNPVNLTVERAGHRIELLLQAERIAYTKPLGLLSVADEANQLSSVKLLTVTTATDRNTLIDPASEGKLMIFDVPEGNNAFQGMKIGQYLESINGETITSLSQLEHVIGSTSDNALVLGLKSNGGVLNKTIEGHGFEGSILEPKTQALIGIQLQRSPLIVKIDPITQFKDNITMMFKTLGSLVNPQSDLKVSNLMGPPGIMRVLHNFSTQDFRLLIWFVVLLNINLAILNLMPIPVLDGGHMLFATIGKLRGKNLPTNFVATTQAMFMIFLFTLMIYVSFFDVRRWQGDSEIEETIRHQRQLYIPTVFEVKGE